MQNYKVFLIYNVSDIPKAIKNNIKIHKNKLIYNAVKMMYKALSN